MWIVEALSGFAFGGLIVCILKIRELQRQTDALRKGFDSQTKLLNARDEYLKSKNKLVDDLVGEYLRVCERLDMLEELEKERQNNEQV